MVIFLNRLQVSRDMSQQPVLISNAVIEVRCNNYRYHLRQIFLPLLQGEGRNP